MSMREMLKYLELEVPHYLRDSVADCHFAGSFKFQLSEDIMAETDVYEVILSSGKKVFAVEGGWNGTLQNVYAQYIPDAETAAKIHTYTLLKLLEKDNPEVRGIADDIADEMGLLKEFRKTG